MDDGRLELTEEMLDRVVYGMENQNERLVLDPADGQLKEKTTERKAVIPLPPWGPSDGYRLMDSFIATLPHTAFRDNLADILKSGSGVFRRYKDELKERPGMEKLWRGYKYREMRKTALAWLSRWSEALALEGLGPEPEDLDDLALSDFSHREANKGDGPRLSELIEAAELEVGSRLSGLWPGASVGETYRELPVEFVGEYVAEGPAGDIVGFSRFEIDADSGRNRAVLRYIYVLPEFRGLGIGRNLTESAIEGAEGKGCGELTLLTGETRSDMRSWLERQGFSPLATVWHREHP